MEDNDNSFTISADQTGGTFKVDNTVTVTDCMKLTIYKCRKCSGVSIGVGMMFSSYIMRLEHDIKFCVYCMLEMFQKHCGEVDEVTDEMDMR